MSRNLFAGPVSHARNRLPGGNLLRALELVREHRFVTNAAAAAAADDFQVFLWAVDRTARGLHPAPGVAAVVESLAHAWAAAAAAAGGERLASPFLIAVGAFRDALGVGDETDARCARTWRLIGSGGVARLLGSCLLGTNPGPAPAPYPVPLSRVLKSAHLWEEAIDWGEPPEAAPAGNRLNVLA